MKIRIIKLLSKIGRILLRLKGVKTGNNLILSGLPRIKIYPGSSISIGNNVTIHSKPKLNPVLSNHSFIATLSSSAKINLGDGCGLSGVTLVSVKEIHIGENTLIGADTLILDNDMHYPLSGTKWGTCIGKSEYGKPIHIGKGCFIGARAVILKGVSIGDGAVVAAGAVVTRDVPFGFLAIGNPASNHPLPANLKHPENP